MKRRYFTYLFILTVLISGLYYVNAPECRGFNQPTIPAHCRD